MIHDETTYKERLEPEVKRMKTVEPFHAEVFSNTKSNTTPPSPDDVSHDTDMSDRTMPHETGSNGSGQTETQAMDVEQLSASATPDSMDEIHILRDSLLQALDAGDTQIFYNIINYQSNYQILLSALITTDSLGDTVVGTILGVSNSHTMSIAKEKIASLVKVLEEAGIDHNDHDRKQETTAFQELNYQNIDFGLCQTDIPMDEAREFIKMCGIEGLLYDT